MKATIEGRPAFAYLQILINPGETIVAESNAMSSMSADLDMETKFNGGFFSGLLKKYLGGESLFINHFSNKTDGQRRLTLVQATPGDMGKIELNGNSLCLQPGAYVASTPGVTLGLKWAGFASLIGREGLFKLIVSGTGTVWYGAYGALLDREVEGEFIVDTSHLVSYEPQLKLKTQLAGGLFTSLFSGEGLVTRVQGKGRISIQTRSLPGLKSWLNPRL
ncbi:MAG: TIGR00266 family protein [Akkermansiaceae bacterium]|nr:TIGR00266 family protein [Verrucomicrobiales bacterium]